MCGGNGMSSNRNVALEEESEMDLRIGRKRVRCGSFAWWCCVAVGVAMLYMVMFTSCALCLLM